MGGGMRDSAAVADPDDSLLRDAAALALTGWGYNVRASGACVRDQSTTARVTP